VDVKEAWVHEHRIRPTVGITRRVGGVGRSGVNTRVPGMHEIGVDTEEIGDSFIMSLDLADDRGVAPKTIDPAGGDIDEDGLFNGDRRRIVDS
jgi:hypothetical protein